MDRGEEDGGGGGGSNAQQKKKRGERSGGSGKGGGCSVKKTEREKQTGKTREAPVLCYSFSCGDITVVGVEGSEVVVEGGGELRTEATVAQRSSFLGLPNLPGLPLFWRYLKKFQWISDNDVSVQEFYSRRKCFQPARCGVPSARRGALLRKSMQT